MRAIIYARCSTDEKRQDVEVQLKELRAYCKREGWNYDEVSEYSSGWKGFPPKLTKVLDLVMKGYYDVLLVYNIDRFSRSKPRSVMKVLFQILDKGCRFIAIQNQLDSNNEMMFNAFIGYWTTFSNMYSQNLSERIKDGMARAKEKGSQIGRPKGSLDKKQRSKKGYFQRRNKIRLDFN